MLERLDAFIGEWSIEASFGPDVPEAPDGIAIIGVDRDT
jgi:hypothetical protein